MSVKAKGALLALDTDARQHTDKTEALSPCVAEKVERGLMKSKTQEPWVLRSHLKLTGMLDVPVAGRVPSQL